MCEQSTCKCTLKEDYSSIDYQLSILQAAKERKTIEVSHKNNDQSDGCWVICNKGFAFNFHNCCYRIKREPSKVVVWSNPLYPSRGIFEQPDTYESTKRYLRNKGWSPSTFIEVMEA